LPSRLRPGRTPRLRGWPVGRPGNRTPPLIAGRRPMSAPSGPLLEWLRKLIQQRGMNSAQLATTVNLPRGRVRKILTGAEPMLVDELLVLTQALEVKPQDVGLAEGAGAEEAETAAPAEGEPKVDAWG